MTELEYIEIELDRLHIKLTELEKSLKNYKERKHIPDQDRIDIFYGAIRHNKAKVVALVRIREIVIKNLKEPAK